MADQQCKEHGLKRGEDYIGVCCVFFCHDGNGRFLLHKRSQQCRDECGRWDCGGGSLEHGETFEEAVRREVREEFCVEPTKVELVEVNNVLRDNGGTPTHWIAALHLVEIEPDQVRNGDPAKVEDLQWFHPDEFPEPLHSVLPLHYKQVHQFVQRRQA